MTGAGALPLAAIAASPIVVAAGILGMRAAERRDASTAPAVTNEPGPTTPPQESDSATWLERVLAFATQVRGTLSNDRLHEVLARDLPGLAGVDDMWIESTTGQRRHLAAPASKGDAASADPFWAAPGEWATFPLQASDAVVGVLGVQVARRPLSTAARRTLTVVAPLIAEALRAARTIEHLRELSTVDFVTGCATRQEGLDRLRAELKRAHRAGQEVAVLMLDLDHFKGINDRYGHQCGDAVLASIGRTIMQALRVSDVRCRWGGEEFLVALPDSGLEQARRAALALARRIAATVTEYDSARIQLTTSIGITIAASGEDDPDPALARADAALYRAKADGRNCIRVMLAESGESAVSAATPPPASPFFRDRRDLGRKDRRYPPEPGRRATGGSHTGRLAAPRGTNGQESPARDVS